ncbi:MAG TPA: oligosaccharide flippase family protein [Longimicrobiales bacterium]|nr:oligosaccharide flippase family protein [Longimicrobiales bacterium]
MGLRGVVLAAILGPALFGVWSLFRLGLRYGALAALGVHRGIEVEVAASEQPPHSGSGRVWGRAAVGYLVGVCGALGIVALAVSSRVPSPARDTLWAIAAGLLAERLWMYGTSYMRAAGYLRRYAIIELAQAGASLLLTAVLARTWGLTGAYLGFALALAFGLFLLGRTVPFLPLWSSSRTRQLLRVGVPLSLAAVVTTLLTTVDRLIVAGFEGTEALGLYSFGVAISSLGASAALVVRTVVFRDVYAQARREGGGLAAASHLAETVVPVASLLPPLLGIVGVALGPVIALLVPRYLEILPVARLFVFIGLGAGFMSLGTIGVVVTRRQRLLPLLSAAGLLANALAAVVALRMGFGLVGVAVGALVSRSITGAGVVAISAADAGTERGGRVAARILWPLAWCAGAVSFLGWWRPATDIGSTAVSMLLYLVALVPLYPMLVKEFGRLSRGSAERSS